MNEKDDKRIEKELTRESLFLNRELQNILIRHWLFGCLPGRKIANLSHQFTNRTYKTGQFVFHQEDKADRLFVLISGEISIESYNISGQMTKIAHLNNGEVFGEFALIDKSGRSASARVTKPSTLASLPGNIFDELMIEHPEFTKLLLNFLVTKLRSSNDQVESLVTLTLLQRTARMLLLLGDKMGDKLSITQAQLSEHLFASREKVNSKLKELERMKTIELGHGSVTILDRDALSSIVLN